jgi:WD40-like Beta Propeller Repeat
MCLLLAIHIEPPDVEAQSGFQIERVSVSSAGVQADIGSGLLPKASISADGNTIAFMSYATNLVPNDTNGDYDIFVHDRLTDATTRVSVASDGTQGNNYSTNASISGDGRYVAFQSLSTNLIAGGTAGFGHVFVHDRQTAQTTLVSTASNGTPGSNSSGYPSISAGGQYVAFESFASNLVPNDTNGWTDIFVHDRQTGETTRVSLASNGAQTNSNSAFAAISGDGLHVAFYSNATNLAASDTNNRSDIFVHDRLTGQTTRVSVASDGTQGNGLSDDADISGDGRYVVFSSLANNLVPNDTNGINDIFVRDRETGTTTRVNMGFNGMQTAGVSDAPSISGDGRYVAFESFASNLVPNDISSARDIFVRDWQGGETTRMNLSFNGEGTNRASYYPAISSDGSHVSFDSAASNLVPGDTNNADDVFVALNVLSIPVVDLNEKSTLNYYTTATPTLTWNRISWAVEYQIEIDNNSGFTTVGRYERTEDGLSHTVETSLVEGAWYWRVRARRDNGMWGIWSAPEIFTVNL